MTIASNADTAFIEEHNQEAQAVWDEFNAGQPTRPPVMIGTGTQFFIFNDDLNPGETVTFEDYCTNAKSMLDFQLRSAVWRAEHIAPYCDDPMGTPEIFEVRVDLQNFDEVTIHGGPNIMLLRDETLEAVAAETHRILESGVIEGGKFVLQEANNLAPRTPCENSNTMYQAARSLA